MLHIQRYLNNCMNGHNIPFWIPHIVYLTFGPFLRSLHFTLDTSFLIFTKRKYRSWILYDLNNIWPQRNSTTQPTILSIYQRTSFYIWIYFSAQSWRQGRVYEQDLKESSSEVSRENEALSNMALVVEWEK